MTKLDYSKPLEWSYNGVWIPIINIEIDGSNLTIEIHDPIFDSKATMTHTKKSARNYIRNTVGDCVRP